MSFNIYILGACSAGNMRLDRKSTAGSQVSPDRSMSQALLKMYQLFISSLKVSIYYPWDAYRVYISLLYTVSFGKTLTHLSTNIPACTACTMLRNLGFSSDRLNISPIWRVKVDASQSRTSEGTESDWMSLSSSSVSTNRLQEQMHTHTHIRHDCCLKTLNG